MPQQVKPAACTHHRFGAAGCFIAGHVLHNPDVTAVFVYILQVMHVMFVWHSHNEVVPAGVARIWRLTRMV